MPRVSDAFRDVASATSERLNVPLRELYRAVEMLVVWAGHGREGIEKEAFNYVSKVFGELAREANKEVKNGRQNN